MQGDKKYGIIALTLAVVSVVLIWIVGLSPAQQKALAQKDEKKDTIYSYVQLIDAVAWSIDSKYMEAVDRKELIYSGIRGMLETLDPFSVMQEKKEYNQLMEMTQGKYQGLGMMIDLRDEIITVVSPIEGTPAQKKGIRAGDKILEIDGKSTKGMSTEDASKLMRGPAGTKVVLTIKREGLAEVLEYELERAVIQLKNVPYYGVLDNNIGYVRLSRFSEESGSELKNALEELQKKKIKGLILDLRNNGGGLLAQAVETADLFLNKGDLIVYTKGRGEEKISEFLAQGNGFYKDAPLAVLVNDGSASASEILAGAIQDWDRGVLIGDTTFGKGLVQQVFDMPNDVYLKLTTAKYYIPSGRSIQKPQLSKRHPSTALVDSTRDKEIFHTKGGRIVYGGGGIVPDIEVKDEEIFTPLEINLERQQMFFDFAVSYLAEHKDLPQDFEVTDQMVLQFKDFLKKKNFTYRTALEIQVDSLEKTIKAQEDGERYQETLKNLKKLVEEDKEKDFDQSLSYIKRSIKRDILNSLYGEKAVYEQVLLKDDPYVKKALEILTTKDKYLSILKS
jgi:carboxyl-terminal processing protease